ncbi:calcium:proton antiporter [Agarivorans sp. OAG1]|uniref:calcium:proton antiporter n=1 Tax=Agarivorans sp. OAG1 TaxID=3082387 RepID=UPI002B283EFA|nr:calcium:proton antiporter [Agarivorans sp. OAG1]
MTAFLKREHILIFGMLLVAFLKLGGDSFLAPTSGIVAYSFTTLILFGIVLAAIFAVVRHSDALAIKLGDPYGTLLLTLSVIILEVVMISSVMLTGDANPVLARDTMFAVIMAVLNGLLGIGLVLGGLRYHTQTFSREGITSYMVAIIPLSVLCLILPNFIPSNSAGAMPLIFTIALIVVSVALYAVFLYTQTKSHSYFFVDAKNEDEHEAHGPLKSNLYHFLLLVGYLAVIILLAKNLAMPIDHGISNLGAPAALGGLIVALLVLAPEGLGGVKAIMKNQLQRAMNLFFGSVLASIALTVPTVLVISSLMAEPITLGLGAIDTTLLIATLLATSVSVVSAKTNVLNGVSHLILFSMYLVLIFV